VHDVCLWIVDSLGKTGGTDQGLYDAGDAMFSFYGPLGYAVGDVAVVGNWNGSGPKRVGIFRASTGTWYVDTNGNRFPDCDDQVFSFGLPSAQNPGGVPDQPIVGLWTVPGGQILPPQ